jgi:hypothetical protein
MVGCTQPEKAQGYEPKDFAKTDPPPGYIESHSKGNDQSSTPPEKSEGK